jgi:hypothetical protein
MSWRELALFVPLAAVLLPSVFRFIGRLIESYQFRRFLKMSPAKRNKLIRREQEKAAVMMGVTVSVLTGAIRKMYEFPPHESGDYLDKR